MSPRIDAHQHFWKYDASEYPWIPAGSPLHRDWLPADLEALQTPLGLEGSIAVQARQTLDETRWLLRLADRHASIRGVVGWVDLRSAELEDQLQEFGRHPRFVGVRHVAQDEPDANFLMRPEVLAGIETLRHFDLTYDILIYAHQLPAAIQLVERVPEQRFVLDHLAKPAIREGKFAEWSALIRQIAQAPNVHCKVSGLATEADHQNWALDDLRPFLDCAFEAFGPDRLMWGSDWPVCLLAADYARVYRTIDQYTANLTAQERDGLFGGNAARVYRLKP